jgi:hypothetical protein
MQHIDHSRGRGPAERTVADIFIAGVGAVQIAVDGLDQRRLRELAFGLLEIVQRAELAVFADSE